MKTNWSFLKKGALVVSLLFYCGILLADETPQPPITTPNPISKTPPPPIGQTGENYPFLVGW